MAKNETDLNEKKTARATEKKPRRRDSARREEKKNSPRTPPTQQNNTPVTGAAARAAWAGAAAGCLHTLSGPDHLAALTPLTLGRSHAAAAALGGLWGFGHCVGQAVLGLAMVLLKDRFASLVPSLAKWGSATVGGTLLAIGCLGLLETYQAHSETAAQAAEAEREAEAEAEALLASSSSSSSSSSGGNSKGGFLGSLLGAKGRFNLWTLATGVVYGLQPDALFVVVPALALPTKAAAAAYMAAFVLGTVGAMGSYAAAIGATSRAIISSGGGGGSGGDGSSSSSSPSSLEEAALRKRRAQAKLSGAASLVAVGVGLAVLASAAGVSLPVIGGAAAHGH